jgi:hypothetical protein
VKGYVRKRGDAWQLAIYVGLDDRKRRQYIYETVTGTRRDAERRLAVLVVEVATAGVEAPRCEPRSRRWQRLGGRRPRRPSLRRPGGATGDCSTRGSFRCLGQLVSRV